LELGVTSWDMGGSYAREHECDVDAFDRQTFTWRNKIL
jgi:hypothetical protein